MLLRLAYLGMANVFALLRAGHAPCARFASWCCGCSSTTWANFLRSQAEALLAWDFFETVTLSGARLHVFAVIEHASRRIRILGAAAHPTASWAAQAARNLVMDLDDAGCRKRFLIRDRDGSFRACSTSSSLTRASTLCSAGSGCRG